MEVKPWERKYRAIQDICADSLSGSVRGMLHQANNTPQVRKELRTNNEQLRIERQRQRDMQTWDAMKRESDAREQSLFDQQLRAQLQSQQQAMPPAEPEAPLELSHAPEAGELSAVDIVDPPAAASAGTSS